MADPLSPYWSTVGVRQIRSEGNAISAASILDFRGSGFAVEHIAATPSQPIPSIRVTYAGPTAAEFATLQGDVTTALADAEAAIVAASAAQAAVTAIEPYAVAGGLWICNPVVTANYSPVEGEYVRVDMTGKVAPDEVMITLPEATASNEGRSIALAEVSPDGVIDGALLKIQIATSQNFDTGLGSQITINNQQGARWTFTAVKHSVSPDVYGWSVRGYDP